MEEEEEEEQKEEKEEKEENEEYEAEELAGAEEAGRMGARWRWGIGGVIQCERLR